MIHLIINLSAVFFRVILETTTLMAEKEKKVTKEKGEADKELALAPGSATYCVYNMEQVSHALPVPHLSQL